MNRQIKKNSTVRVYGNTGISKDVKGSFLWGDVGKVVKLHKIHNQIVACTIKLIDNVYIDDVIYVHINQVELI